MARSWLIEFVALAAKEKWCNKLWCTTCGAMEFRGGLAHRVCNMFGIPLPEPPTVYVAPHPPLLHDLPTDLQQRATEIVAQELRTVRFSDFLLVCDHQYAEHSVGLILYEIGVRPDQPLIFQSHSAWQILEGSEVGDYAVKWRAYSDQRTKERQRRDEYQSPQAAAHRREDRRRMRAEASELRFAARLKRNQKRIEFLEELRVMPTLERIRRLAEGNDPWPLDAIPAVMIQELLPLAEDVPRQWRAAFSKRIGHRKGIWAQLRKRLDRAV